MSAQIRIYELARQLDVTSAEVLDVCRELNIAAKTASSSIGPPDIETVSRRISTPKGKVVEFDDRTGRGLIELERDHRMVKFDLRETKLGAEKFSYLQRDNDVELEFGDDDESVAQITPL